MGAKPAEPPRGLYVHGAVGRGKTMLMDLFFDAVEVPAKRRAHFHAFMADVHARLHAWRQARKKGEVDGRGSDRARRGGARARGLAPLLRRIRGARHRRCDDSRAPVHGAVRGRRRRGRDLQRRARRPLQGRAQSRALPALHRAPEGALRDRRARGAHRLPAREARPRAGLLHAARAQGRRRARRRLPCADRGRARRADRDRTARPRSRRAAGGRRRRPLRFRRSSAGVRSARPTISRSPSASIPSSSTASR